MLGKATIVGLLLAIAVIQIYGQLRTKRYKELGDVEVGRISVGVDSIGSEVKQQGIELGRLAAYLTTEEEDSFEAEG